MECNALEHTACQYIYMYMLEVLNLFAQALEIQKCPFFYFTE